MEETAVGRERGSWDVESSVKLAKIVSDLGVDLIDVSSGGNHPEQKLHLFNADYQTNIAGTNSERTSQGWKADAGSGGRIDYKGRASARYS